MPRQPGSDSLSWGLSPKSTYPEANRPQLLRMQVSADFTGVTEGGEGGVVPWRRWPHEPLSPMRQGCSPCHHPPPARTRPVLTWPVNNSQIRGVGGNAHGTKGCFLHLTVILAGEALKSHRRVTRKGCGQARVRVCVRVCVHV